MNRFGRAIIVGVCICAMSGCFARGQQRGTLPPLDVWPRTKEAWDAQESEGWRQLPLSDVVPQEFARAREHMAWMTDRYAASDTVCDTALAEALIGELWTDHGHFTLNKAMQYYILDILIQVGRFPEDRLPPEARAVLVAGVKELIAAGGAETGPAQQALVAEVLDPLAWDDEEAQGTVELLLCDALDWTETVHASSLRRAVERSCRKHWGDNFDLRMLDYEVERWCPVASMPERYKQAVAKMDDLLAKPLPKAASSLERLREAARAAQTELKDEQLEHNLLTRLLIVYRCLLERRPQIPLRLADHIDVQLVQLAGQEFLTTDKHWSVWAEAACALGKERASDRIKRFVSQLLHTDNLKEAQRRAAETVRMGLSIKLPSGA